ncbi:hypothetical protein C474_20806 [Halogeometricum pallidum JCM 14848]|uniref:Uncharacterized protein n=1 Tax=Halogeometricum pallidum JCM 14848 TaxID=1227487 RepID=M0CSD7_HALPD|nr:hypothetical protein C474_20806 [Halogeometricum pallidum JCM 14848]
MFSKIFIYGRVYALYVMSEDDANAVAQYLTEHPRMMGVLFTALLLLSQAGSVAAGNHVAINGP